MTEEEKLAEEQIKKWDSLLYPQMYPVALVKDFIRKAFLAGLKAGKDMAETDLATVAYMQGAERYKPKWHKVSEQIPTEEKDYLVKLTDGTVDVMRIALDGDLEPYLLSSKFDFYKDVEKWCEIPLG
jgi:hypothetical protein